MNTTEIKRFLIGEPFPTSQEIHERLDKVRGLAVFASDPISSNAYATEAIMSVVILLGSGALWMTLPIAGAVALLVLMVVFSYIQTIMHYPKGGGAYMVAKDNLGKYPSLIAAAALLTDYILTVAVSSSAGVRAVSSAIPEAHDYRVFIALLAIAFITWINLRGMRESGTVFAFPTYAFAGGVLLVVGIGILRNFQLFGFDPLPVHHEVVEAEHEATGLIFVWLLLRAFAGGCTALTGIEAISDGVPAFKPPESKNAATTMVAMGIIAMSLFIGITFVATHMELVPEHEESILSQMTRGVVGKGPIYIWVQFFTAAILFLAANTGYQDFPRLSSFLARDGFLPRWMQNRGDRLVFSSGIVVLGLTSSLLVIIFNANEIAMLPLYALGVMLSFTVSQAGMRKLMGRIGQLKPGEVLDTGITTVHYESGWWWKRWVNTFGAIVTGTVLVILVVTKFVEGGWIIALMIPLLVFMFMRINHHYADVSNALSTKALAQEDALPEIADVVIVPIGDVHRGSLMALQYAKRISKDTRAVSISTAPGMHERIQKRWDRFPKLTEGIKLIIIDYDYRDVLTPLVAYIDEVNNEEFPDQTITVVIPEFVTGSILSQLLHNQTAAMLANRLKHQQDVIIIDVPYRLNGD